MQLTMPKPSPQLTLSAAACAAAMAALALSGPTISGNGSAAPRGVSALAGIEGPTMPALPGLLPR